MKIAIFYIATDKYIQFFEDFYNSVEKNFLPKYEKNYYFFTDNPESISDRFNLTKNKISHEKWPYVTLNRFNYFLSSMEESQKNDYAFFFNSNTIVNKKIEEDTLNIHEHAFFFTLHPAFYNKPIRKYPFENRKKSLAYLKANLTSRYYCGGFYGGEIKSFFQMCNYIDIMISKDRENNYIAKWHDESYLNKYVNDVLRDKNICVLKENFCFPEDWEYHKEIYIKILDKSKYFNVDKFKNNSIGKYVRYKLVRLYFKFKILIRKLFIKV